MNDLAQDRIDGWKRSILWRDVLYFIFGPFSNPNRWIVQYEIKSHNMKETNIVKYDSSWRTQNWVIYILIDPRRKFFSFFFCVFFFFQFFFRFVSFHLRDIISNCVIHTLLICTPRRFSWRRTVSLRDRTDDRKFKEQRSPNSPSSICLIECRYLYICIYISVV